jgi:tetratricopeptide (TPR) repeat protein
MSEDFGAEGHASSDANTREIDQMIERIRLNEKRIETMKEEVDALQVNILKKHKDPALVVAILALLFSFGTTAVSAYRTYKQDIHDSRAELRTLIQRLTVLPRENTELLMKYSKQGTVSHDLSAALNQENVVLARQATEVISRIPTHVSATEYMAVYNALQAGGLLAESVQLLDKAIVKADSAYDATGALRTKAMTLVNMGKLNEARIEMQRAADIFKTYPSEDERFIAATNAQTEVTWAFLEAVAKECAESKKHLAKAKSLILAYPEISPTFNLSSQIDDVEKRCIATSK